MSYLQQKTPFYLVAIGDAGGQNMIELPFQIMRLLEKVEISEAISQGCVYSTITLVFNEGSREPFALDSDSDTSSIYQGVGTGSNISNKTGMLTDLVFTEYNGSVGFTSLAAADVGKKLLDAAKTFGTLTEQSSMKVNKTVKQAKKVHYLFQENNQVKVTWGYKEDPNSTRSVRAHIKVVQSDFPDSGPIKTTITCIPPTGLVDQVAATKGITFTNRTDLGVDTLGNILYVQTDKKLEDVVKEIASSIGDNKPIISKELKSSSLGKVGSKRLIAGESLHQFLIKQAQASDAYYTIFLEPETGKPRVLFVNKADLLKTPVIKNKNLFNYKQPGSIVKNISIKADFDGVAGQAFKGFDSSGKEITIGTNNGASNEVLFDGQVKLDSDPTTGNPSKAAEGIRKQFGPDFDVAIGRVTTPPSENETYNTHKAESRSNCQGRMVVLEMNTLGFTKISSPFTIYIGGIGQRYSGFYSVKKVTHTIDSTGYFCNIVGDSSAVSGQIGVMPDEATKTEIKDSGVSSESMYMTEISAANISKPKISSADPSQEYKNTIQLA